jgi:YidC/Oxa1 family membrane protein insertase
VHVLATNPIQPLINLFEAILVFFHDNVGLGWGLSIVVMTVIVRACLLPLTLKQFKSMQALAQHAPEMKKLQERYKGDKERLNQEMMKFYRENRINPAASCLPMIAQLPVFLALFYMLREDLKTEICGIPAARVGELVCEQVEPGSGQFLFIPDLTDNATGWVLVVLVVLYVSSQLLSSILMPSTIDRTQRMIFMALPFIFVPFILGFPAGLIVYWITTNLWTVSQQTALRKIMGAPKPPPLNPDGTRPGPFDELLKQFRKPPAEQAANGGDKGGQRKREKAAVTSASEATEAAPAAEKAPRERPQREPGSKPPPPPRKRAKKRSGRRR